MSYLMLPASFAILLAGALMFTNAIEWFGSLVRLGQGAVGSLLAAVATALPESLIPIVAGAHIFVEEVLHVADSAGLEPLVLSLVLAPFATELPEKANSFFWVRAGKDSLALGNVTGAMVFQSTIPVAIGLAFTHWELDTYSVLAGGLALAGGFVAILTLQIRRRFSGRAIFLWATFYAVFVAYVVAAS